MYIKIVLLLILAGGVVLGYAVQRTAPNNADYSSSQSENKEFRIQNSKDLVPQIKNVETTVFIPYWNIPASSAEVENYDTLIYFGVVPDENGKMISDLGFKNIESFIQNTSNRQTRVLTIRMLDTDSNLAILDDVSRQTTVVRQTVGLIEDYGFDGIIQKGIRYDKNLSNLLHCSFLFFRVNKDKEFEKDKDKMKGNNENEE